MRKLYFYLLLPLLMLLSQQGAAWHDIGHLTHASQAARAAQQQQQQQPPSDDGQPCKSCLAFAHLGIALKPAVIHLQLASLGQQASTGSTPASIAADVPAHRSRGPPKYL
ncbi:hypothetical protein ACVBEH_19320 [Roseateles sp. GG27B]